MEAVEFLQQRFFQPRAFKTIQQLLKYTRFENDKLELARNVAVAPNTFQSFEHSGGFAQLLREL